MVFPCHLFIFIVFILPCLFVSLMFLFKASKDTPCPLPPSQHPPSPRAVRMICKLQTTKSPSLVSSAHLGNSISRVEGGGERSGTLLPPSALSAPVILTQAAVVGLQQTPVSSAVSFCWEKIHCGKRFFTSLISPNRDVLKYLWHVVKLLWLFYPVSVQWRYIYAE